MVSTVKAQSGLRTAIHQAARHRSAPEARSRPHAGFWKKETAVGASPGEAPLTIFQAGLGGAGDTERWRGQGWWLEGVQGQGSDPEAFPSAWKTSTLTHSTKPLKILCHAWAQSMGSCYPCLPGSHTEEHFGCGEPVFLPWGHLHRPPFCAR